MSKTKPGSSKEGEDDYYTMKLVNPNQKDDTMVGSMVNDGSIPGGNSGT